MKATLLTVISLWMMITVPNCMQGQDEGMGFTSVQPHTHALIIGISSYLHLDDLQFADRDATVFREYLINSMDCRKDSNNIVTLLNEEAVSPRVYQALEDLVSLVEEGDKVYVYFSGHGDSENITIFKSGFLLTHDTPKNSYYTNSINVDILNHFIHTLSSKNKAEVTFIADACRSGKLGNSNSKGAAQTARVLTENVADEVRVLSCQPNEVSLEGKEWGGGMGLFSYYLINGLYGMADTKNPADGQISLNELNIYLSTNVPRDADPVNQYPGIYGPMNKIIGRVQQGLLARLKASDNQPKWPCQDAVCKGYDERFLASLNPDQMSLYNAFYQSIDNRRLRSPAGNNAYDQYKLLKSTDIEPHLEALVRRKLIAALQSESQLFISELSDVSKRWHEKDMRFDKWAHDVLLSADLLGKDHYLFQTLMGKHYFFAAANYYYRTKDGKEKGNPMVLLNESLKLVNKAIATDALVVYYQNLKGVILSALNYMNQAIDVFDVAIELSPDYPYPHANKAKALLSLQRYEEAIEHCNESIALDPDFINAYQYKMTALKRLDRQSEATEVYRELMQINNKRIGL